MKRAAVIGCGALGTILVTNFARAEGWTLTGVMARTKAHAEALAANAGCRAATTLEELLADKPDLVVEIAGIGAAKAYGEAVLEQAVTSCSSPQARSPTPTGRLA